MFGRFRNRKKPGQTRLGTAGILLIVGALLYPKHGWTAPQPEKAGNILVQGGHVWYRINGANHVCNTPILVVHGGPGFSHDYLLPLTDFARERPVIFYDQLDSGNSERPGNPVNWTVERYVSEIDAVRRSLKLDQVILLGSSWGGALVAEYATRRPSGLLGLVLESPLLSAKRWVADNKIYRNQLPEEVKKILDKHEADGTTDSDEYQKATMEFYKKHLNRMEPWPEELLRSFAIANMKLYTTMWGKTEFSASGTLKDYDITPRLGRIETPTLIVCGEHDEATPDACRYFSSLIPRSTAKIIPGASHTAHLERGELFLRTVRDFLAELPSDRQCKQP